MHGPLLTNPLRDGSMDFNSYACYEGNFEDQSPADVDRHSQGHRSMQTLSTDGKQDDKSHVLYWLAVEEAGKPGQCNEVKCVRLKN